MDFNERHPLESITRSKSLSMLEALIPFVDYPLKLPLALLIKYYEINRIMQVFQSLDNLSRFGLHNVSRDPMDMMCALTGIPPDVLKMMSSFSGSQAGANPMDLMSMFNSQNSIKPQPAPVPTDSSFEQNIQSIFSEYDMMQAAEYDGELKTGENFKTEEPAFSNHPENTETDDARITKL